VTNLVYIFFNLSFQALAGWETVLSVERRSSKYGSGVIYSINETELSEHSSAVRLQS